MLDVSEFEDVIKAIAQHKKGKPWSEKLNEQLELILPQLKHAELKQWQNAVAALPAPDEAVEYQLGDCVVIGHDTGDPAIKPHVKEQLMQLRPWRKGPFNFFGVQVDTEWRSDWKWQRISPHIDSLADKTVLDVGCGSGYHLWRMREQGANFVLGIDPSLLFWQQFQCAKKYLQHEPVHFLPLRSEDLPERLSLFDTVFSMGVLYHRRSPLDHIIELRNALKPGGQLILETLVIDIAGQNLLFPKDRYAMMRNVFFLPNIELLSQWLKRLGFIDIEVANMDQTTCEEQRVTEWVKSKSLKDFLDPENPNLTIEGYPAPLRATLIARKDPKYQ